MDDQLNDEQVEAKLRYIALNGHYEAAPWDRTNYYDLLKKVHALNCSLPKERRVHIYPADLDFNWTNATKRSWTRFDDKAGKRRDNLMAVHVLSRFKQLRQADGQVKGLVIMNYRHAFPELKAFSRKEQNTGAFLMAAYPGRVANVMINTVAPEPHWAQLPINRDRQGVFIPVQGGKWDAAFAVLSNPSLGFDFNGSPMGEDAFDLFPFRRIEARYREVFTGFVFYKPLREHRLSFGFPKGMLDEPLVDEVLKRSRLLGNPDSREGIENYYGNIRVSTYRSESDYEKMIRRWLETPGEPR